jgi:hypothetical protein|tara:strand:+ start:1265 stop:1684 length:420 start_codon:yes stop_codon:yes gene_type:complete
MPNFTPNEYQNKIEDIDLIFNSLQQDYDNKTIQDDETANINSNTYSDQWDNLIMLQNQMFNDIEEVYEIIDTEDIKISKYDTDNKILKNKYIDLRDKIQGAIGMKDDTQTLYNQEYYGNILIFFSIIGGCVLYTRTRNL